MGGAGDSKVGSCVQVIRSNGEIFAVSHPHKKTGFKAANSETNVRMLGSKTSYKQFYEDEVALPTVTKNPKGMGYKYARLKIPLKTVTFPYEIIRKIALCKSKIADLKSTIFVLIFKTIFKP